MLAIKYCLRAGLQPEINNVECSIVGCEVHTKKVESCPFSPSLFLLQLCLCHSSPTCNSPSLEKAEKQMAGGRQYKQLGKV